MSLTAAAGFAFLTTPFVRVALAAQRAKAELKPFSRRDVEPWMIAPVATVYLPKYQSISSEVTITSGEHIAIRPIGATGLEGVVQPLAIRHFDETRDWVIEVGGTRVLSGLVADFPMTALRTGFEFYFLLRQDESGLNVFRGHMKTVTVPITKDLLALAGCPLACPAPAQAEQLR